MFCQMCSYPVPYLGHHLLLQQLDALRHGLAAPNPSRTHSPASCPDISLHHWWVTCEQLSHTHHIEGGHSLGHPDQWVT